MLLLRTGKQLRSAALTADGWHLMADVVTSLGLIIGVGLVVLTGIIEIDPVVAALAGVYVLWSGLGTISSSVGALMDAAPDHAIVTRIRELLAESAAGALEVHDLRMRHAGRLTYLEFHLVVPGSMTVAEAHAICDRIEFPAAYRNGLPRDHHPRGAGGEGQAPRGTDPVTLDLFTPEAVRTQCNAVLALAQQDRLRHLRLAPQRLDNAADYVAAVTRDRFPDLRVPLHSRWRHFGAGGVDRRALYPDDPAARLELCILSVLLDAGAGSRWTYREPGTGLSLTRSEGLAVASLHAFRSGLLRADTASLAACSETALAEAFQASDANPLEGLAGRAALLRRLGAVLQDRNASRLSDLFAPLRTGAGVTARDILILVLRTLPPIWPRPEGDVWQHPDIGPVPLHKLSQWLSYSLTETLEMEGITVTGLDALTGLAEYRNGRPVPGYRRAVPARSFARRTTPSG